MRASKRRKRARPNIEVLWKWYSGVGSECHRQTRICLKAVTFVGLRWGSSQPTSLTIRFTTITGSLGHRANRSHIAIPVATRLTLIAI